MTTGDLANSAHNPRWGEGLLIAAVAPGSFAAAVLGLGFIVGYLGWPSTLGPFTNAFAWAAISTPMLAVLGTLTLVCGALVAPFVPGRPRWKWGVLLIGTLAWGAAFYALHVPGLIELP